MQCETAAQRQVRRVRRLRIHLAAWSVATVLITALWVLHEWQANGAFERFAHEGNDGDWNPTLPALAIGIWALVVGIMALRVLIERPVTTAEIDREADWLAGKGVPAGADLESLGRTRAERVRRLRFHAAAWLLGVIMVTPLNALIEWQDNGGFERFSSDSQPGSWDPWALYVGGIWAVVVAAFALWVYFDRPRMRGTGGVVHN